MSRKLTDKAKTLLSQENGTLYKDHSNRIRFALAFPNVYRLGMSTLGLQIVYRVINDEPDALAERVFLPDPEDMPEYERTNTKLFTLESQTPVADFDVLAFSISFELDYVNVLRILSLSGIPVRSSDRDETDPLIIAGGPAVTVNPEPLAEFLDVVVIGEAEDVVPEIIEVLREQGAVDRRKLLETLSGIDGVYIPSLYTPEYSGDGTISMIHVSPPAPTRVKRRLTSDLSRHNASSVILTQNCEFPEMLLTEVIRGCSRQCRFCVAGYTNLPPRPRELNLQDKGAARVGLVGSAVFDHPEAPAICAGLLFEGKEFSVSSIRIETLNPELADAMFRGGQRTMTIAPEAGSERLRLVINKPLSDQEIIDAVEMGHAAGFNRIKLYYMIGLPGEEDSDIDGIPALARELSSRYHSVVFQISISCYVPKPWTPFQWCAMEDEKSLTNKLNRVRKALSKIRKVQSSAESPRLAAIQALFARGDRRLSSFLEKTAELQGNYREAAAQTDVDTQFYVNRVRGEDEIFPWDHIDMRVRKDYLRRELKKAYELKATAACKVGACQRCGVC